MKTTTLAGLALAVGLAGALPAASFAQPDPRSAAPEARGERPMMRQRMSPEQRAERRAERLRVMLQLRPEQDRALREYVAALQGARGDRMGRRGEMRQMSTPDRLQAQRERLTERLAAFDRRAAATSRFYGQLTPAQRQAFDAMGAQRGGRGMRGGRMRGPGGFAPRG